MVGERGWINRGMKASLRQAMMSLSTITKLLKNLKSSLKNLKKWGVKDNLFF